MPGAGGGAGTGDVVGARGVPRAVATDLDGTLLRSDGTVSPRSVDVLEAVEHAGATVVLVTGRPPRWLAPVIEATGHTGTVICANGGLVLDAHRGRVVRERSIQRAVLTDVVARLDDALPGLAFAVEYADGFARETTYEPSEVARRVEDAVVRSVERGTLLDRPAVKLLARHPDADPDELLARAREVVGDLVELTHSTRGAALLEISASGVSKATALAELCAERGVGAGDVVAFGDMPNDLPMLAWAGRPYAMANAHREVLSAVARHAPSNDDDGVAVVLEQLFRL